MNRYSQRYKKLPGGQTSYSSDHSDILFLQCTNDRNAITLLVRPLREDWIDDNSQAVAIVLILDPSLSVEASDSELSQLFGFSLAESRIANLLMDGLPLDQCITASSVLHSLRSHSDECR